MVQKEVKKKTTVYGATAILLGLVLVSMVYVFGTSPTILQNFQPLAVGAMKTFSSLDELKNYLNTNAPNNNPEIYWARSQTSGANAPVPAHIVTGAISGAEDFSSTNIQVAGVDEADTVKTDGQYIYTLSSSQGIGYDYYNGYSTQTANNIYILNADPQDAKVVSKINLDDSLTPAGLFLSSDSSKLVVLATKYQPYPVAST